VLPTGLEDMKLLIQQRHGQRFNMKYELKGKQLPLYDMQNKRSKN
jgi:hypothetical protein